MSSTSSEQPAAASAPTLWLLADCNNFFVSCEQLFRPDLIGRPVVVLSNNDGCIVARSPEAKALGIKMGAPEFQVRPLLKAHGVTVFSSNFALYGDISARVMATLAHLCPDVRQYSIDEAFIPLSGGLANDAAEAARTIRDTVRRWTGITVSVGAAPTKTLAKVANHLAKRGSGVRLLTDPADIAEALADFPVEEVWGIGRRLAAKLRLFGVYTAGRLAAMDDDWLRRALTVGGLRTARELRGIPSVSEDDAPAPRRTLVVSRSFGERTGDLESLKQAVAVFTARACERLRRAGLLAGGVAVHIRTSLHGDQVYDAHGGRRLAEPTDDTGPIQAAALSVLRELFRPGPAYAKAGVMLFDLCGAEGRQYALFPSQSPEERARREALMRAVDGVNRKLGPETLRFGAAGPEDAAWRLKREHRSPRATTCWEELARVRCG